MRTREKGKESAEHFIFWSEAEEEKQKWSRKERVNRTSRQTHPRLGFQTSWTGIKIRRRSESNKIGTTKKKAFADRQMAHIDVKRDRALPTLLKRVSIDDVEYTAAISIFTPQRCSLSAEKLKLSKGRLQTDVSLCQCHSFPSILFTTSESCSLKSESSSFTP